MESIAKPKFEVHIRKVNHLERAEEADATNSHSELILFYVIEYTRSQILSLPTWVVSSLNEFCSGSEF